MAGNDEGIGGVFDRAFRDGLAARSTITAPGGKTYVVVPNGFDLKLIDEFLDKPRQLHINVQMQTLDAFTDYVEAHGEPSTAIFADVKAPAIMAIIDFHNITNEPTKRSHRVRYSPVLSEEWGIWTGMNGKWQSQADFIRFIEEHRADIDTPDGATVLELVQMLEAKKDVSFKSGIRLDNTTMQLAYVEETSASAGVGGQIKIPTELTLGLPVFYRGAMYAVTAFFRYRIHDAKLGLKIDLHRPQQILDTAFGELIAVVREKSAGRSVYEAALPT